MSDAQSRSAFLVLLALKADARHGYDIAQHIEERTRGFIKLSFGALYPVLHKLEADGLIKGDWHEPAGAKRKKVYSLTAKGRKALAEQTELHRAETAAFARLLGARG